MSFNLKIKFQGLIGYVPTNGGKSLLALLVEARKGHQTSDGHHLPSHVPVIQFDRRNALNLQELARLDSNDNQKILYHGQGDMKSESELKGLWFLDDQDLELSYERERSDRKFQVWDEAMAHNAGVAENTLNFFSSLPHLENLASASSRVDPDCLLPNPKDGLVAGRFKIDDGIVQALNPPRDDGGNLIQVHFRPLGSEDKETVFTQQYIGHGMVLEIEVPGESVTLMAKKFDSTEAKAMLKLAPVEGESASLEIQVWNLPLYDIFGLPSFGHSSTTEDRHFELFYELCQRRPPLHKRPIPYFVSSTQNGNGGGHGHGGPVMLTTPWCPPAVFQS